MFQTYKDQCHPKIGLEPFHHLTSIAYQNFNVHIWWKANLRQDLITHKYASILSQADIDTSTTSYLQVSLHCVAPLVGNYLTADMIDKSYHGSWESVKVLDILIKDGATILCLVDDCLIIPHCF